MTRIETGPAALDGPLSGPAAAATVPGSAASRRGSGLLLHPTSLPGPYGIGDLGPAAYQWVDHLNRMQQKWWQVLPLGPTGYGDSPYQCFSAMAGNPYLISPTALLEEGLLNRSDIPPVAFPEDHVDFGPVIKFKVALLERAWENFQAGQGQDVRAAFEAFVEAERQWLDDFALFMALKDAHGGVAWTDWDLGAALRDPAALDAWRERLAPEVEHYRREQALFFTQARALKDVCRDRGIRLMGDVPIYVAHDSADVWANPSLFKLDDRGRLLAQAGVPPDYFSATGQLWGNPIYDWDAMRAEGYAWWIRRMRSAFDLFDLVRVDHFRGFEGFWEVPAGDATAENGRWVPGPGAELFEAITRALGPLPIIAENLGVITPAVEALRERLGYPGMSILQFAFGTDDRASTFQPHHYTQDLVVYTGTHDNDTTVGWWESTGAGDSTRDAEQVEKEKDYARRYLATDGREMHWTLIRAALASVADTAIIPLQDVLGLGSEARMNLPGRESGNWSFRFSWDQLTPEITARLRGLVDLYQR